MASEPIRDPKKDQLLTPQNSAFIIIDYQPVQVNSIASMDRQLMVNNIVGAAKAAVAYGLPIVHSTVNVKTGLNKPPIVQLRRVLDKFPTYDRTSINSWEDIEFRKAVEATGRKKLIMTALWTVACLTFPALDALAAGFEVYVVADAVGGTSVAAHDMPVAPGPFSQIRASLLFVHASEFCAGFGCEFVAGCYLVFIFERLLEVFFVW